MKLILSNHHTYVKMDIGYCIWVCYKDKFLSFSQNSSSFHGNSRLNLMTKTVIFNKNWPNCLLIVELRSDLSTLITQHFVPMKLNLINNLFHKPWIWLHLSFNFNHNIRISQCFSTIKPGSFLPAKFYLVIDLICKVMEA